MKQAMAFRTGLVAAALLGMALISGATAKAKDADFSPFAGAYSGTVSFPTTFFGMPVAYAGPGILLVSVKGKVATVQFICGVGAPQAFGVSINILSKLKSNGSLSATGVLNGLPFAPVVSKYKLRGKTLVASYTMVEPTSTTSIALSSTIKFAGKTATLSGPATFTYIGGVSPGTFTFKGKRVLP